MKRFDTHGGTFAPQGYMKVEAGGTHEENPNGGVQIGVDPNGVPNMLEENESVYQDFVYSNQIIAEADILKEFSIPEKYAGKHYSDIVDEYVDEDRPNDPIANNGMNAMLIRIANAQEEQKKRQEMKEIEEELSEMSPEEISQLEALLSQPEEERQFAIGGDLDSTDERVLHVDEPVYDKFGNIIIKGVPPVLSMPGASTVSTGAKLSAKGKQALEGAKNRAKFTTWLKSLPGLTSKEEAARLAASDFKKAEAAAEVAKAVEVTPEAAVAAEELVKTGTAAPKAARHLGRKIGIGLGVPAALTVGWHAASPLLRDRELRETVPFAPSDSIYTDEPVIDWLNVEKCGGKINRYDNGGLPTWPRYAGATTAGLLGIYDAFQKPDTYKVPAVSPTLITTRFKTVNPVYNPIDSNAAVNDILSTNAGTVRGLRNSGLGPSTGAAIIAADYNAGRNIGKARTESAEYNSTLLNNIIGQINANRQAEAKVMLNKDKINSSLLYDAAVRNAQGYVQQQQLNYGAEGQKYAAIQNQIDQVAQALSGIGNENFAMNQANSAGYVLTILPDGNYAYVKPERCGGNLMRKYKK